jgi:hypothetical protein
MLVPLERRWQPPEGVIRIFETEGFTWGGKWALYDNMHFEYRPELYEINRLLARENAGADLTGTESAGVPAAELHHLMPGSLRPPKNTPLPLMRLLKLVSPAP